MGGLIRLPKPRAPQAAAPAPTATPAPVAAPVAAPAEPPPGGPEPTRPVPGRRRGTSATIATSERGVLEPLAALAAAPRKTLLGE